MSGQPRAHRQAGAPRRALILGAGPAGLVTGQRLLEEGFEVALFEKLPQVGGMCRTWRWHDFHVDTGPHIFHTPDPMLADYWEREFGDLFVKGEFWCKNVRGERFDEYWDYPLSWESISRYPADLKARILGELETRSRDAMARATNYAEHIDGLVGPTLREMFFESYPEKVWGIPTTRMTPDWAPKRVEFRQKVTPFYQGQWNAVGKYGTGCIYERIAERIRAAGGRIHLDTTVTGMETEGSRLSCLHFADRPPVSLGPDDVVISTLPITLTSRFVGHASQLSFRGICSVYLAYKRREILPDGLHWLYYGAPDIDFNRITEPKRLSPHVAPDGQTFLTVEITFSPGDEIDSLPEAELCKRVAKQVERVGLAPAAEVFDASLNKERFVYPLQYAGYQEELAKARAAVSRYEQLYSIGTGGDFNYADSQVLFHKAFDTVEVLCGKDAQHHQVIRRTPRVALNRTVAVGDRRIGQGEPAFVIAEAGLNHNGSLEMAKRLIDEAHGAGCDAVKLQSYQPDSRVSRKVKAARYAETIVGTEETIYEMFERLALSEADQRALFAHARERGVRIFSTPFDEPSVELLESLGAPLYKVASMDLVNLPLIRRVARTGKPLILSTGMSTLGQVEEAVEAVRSEGNPNLILLHCNSAYPAAPEEMNLRVIETLKRAFGVPVGLSDHTFGLFVSHTALALGAEVIERHFTLDRMLDGPDHILSSEPAEMGSLVQMARQIPLVLGDGVKRIQPNEYATLNTQRKSLYARADIRRGQVIGPDDVAIRGPGGGVLPKYLDLIVGRTARADIESDHPITWEAV